VIKKKRPASVRAKISAALKGRPHSEERKSKMRAARYHYLRKRGRKHAAEQE
jgi:hypothetical protein